MQTARFFLFSTLVMLAAACGPGAGAEQRDPANAPAAFVDTFTSIDEARWRVSDGWTNGDWTANDWRASQIRKAPRGIEITLAPARDGDKPYSSGELQSEDVFHYGYFETRLQAPRGSGLVTGFFTYTRPSSENTWDEIDIEILGRDTRSIQFTRYRGGRRQITTVPLPFDAADGQHTYAFEWTANAIRWYADGQLLHEATSADGPMPRREQRLYLHLWNTETLNDWLGPIIPSEAPWRLQVTCIAYAPVYEGRSLCANPQ